MEKMTVAKINEARRNKAIEEINANGLVNFVKVAGTKYAIDVEIEGLGVAPIRVDIVSPKDTGDYAEFTAQAMYEAYEQELEQKEIEAQAKAEAKAKKIQKDTAKRAKAKAEKEE